MITFGRDGYLYIAMGDGGSQGDPHNNGQSLSTLLGKILRIDVDHGSPYSSPSTNPFVHRAGARHEIWDYGFRNPWRFSFDRSTHGLFIGDVGQNTYEEVDVEHASSGGHNYGWRQMEGRHCYNPPSGCNRSGKVLPIAEYTHAGGNCAIVGGYVYRGPAYSTLNGAYFYGDNCSGRIWAMDAAAALRGTSSVRQVLDTSLSISSFGEDQAGGVFVCSLSGTIYRIKAA
jgi:glucose/arabinose dehydrogenase